MDWKQIPLGPLQTNCYVLFNKNKEAVIFDPGGHGDVLNAWLSDNNLQPLAVLLTHAHFDHIGAVEDVRQKWNIPVYLHESEQDWLTDPEKNGSSRFLGDAAIKAEPADVFITKESELNIGSFHFTLFHTPGHSPGSISFYHKETKTVFQETYYLKAALAGRTCRAETTKRLLPALTKRLCRFLKKLLLPAAMGMLLRLEMRWPLTLFFMGFLKTILEYKTKRLSMGAFLF